MCSAVQPTEHDFQLSSYRWGVPFMSLVTICAHYLEYMYLFGVSSQLFRILHTLFYPCLDTLNTHSYSPLTHEKMPLFLIFILTDALDPSKEVSRTPPPSQIIVMILNDVDQLMFIKGFCVCLKILMRPQIERDMDTDMDSKRQGSKISILMFSQDKYIECNDFWPDFQTIYFFFKGIV